MTSTTAKPIKTLTAGDLMHQVSAVIPQRMLMRQAVRLTQQAGTSEAPVVEENGRCIGMLTPADVFRWIEAGCPEAVVGPNLHCPYQVRGRLLAGGEAVICVLAHGNCPYQTTYPSLAGAHTDVCMRPETADSPFGVMSAYMTTNIATVEPEAPLPELVRQMIDTPADRLIVVDESGCPIGIVSAVDVLSAVANDLGQEFSLRPSRRG